MADEATGETKPKAEAGGGAFQLVVKDQNGGEVHFKVKPHTKFQKIMESYATNKAVEAGQVRFLFEGRRIEPNNTPADLGLEAEDVIDAVQEQTGGAIRQWSSPLTTFPRTQLGATSHRMEA